MTWNLKIDLPLDIREEFEKLSAEQERSMRSQATWIIRKWVEAQRRQPHEIHEAHEARVSSI